MKLEDLNPKNNPAMSLDFYRYLKARHRTSLGSVDVYKHKDGRLFVGYSNGVGSLDFIGATMASILFRGGRAQKCCFPGAMRNLKKVKAFWSEYEKKGKCAIDPSHKKILFWDRWDTKKTVRYCKHCGHKQVKKTRVKRLIEETWEDSH